MLASDTSTASIVAAFDALPQPVFVVDGLRPGRSNAYVNAAYSAFTGYPAAEAVSASFDALAVFAEPDKIAPLTATADLAPSTRVSVRRRDGTTVPAVLHLRTVPRSDGGRYVIGMLEPRADESTSEASAAAGRKAFLSWLNHELRSPLNACGMWLDVLALAPQPDKLTKAVDAIKRNLARQTRLVNDLNDASKASAGGIELELAPLDLASLLARGLDAWRALALAKPLTLEHRIELGDARIDGDAERLAQAFNHLLENAIGSTPSGGRVALRARETSGRCVVEVDDAGIALSAEDAAHLGRPLWRAPTSGKSRSGLGLGLAIAHHIVTQHGGALTASSDATGTHFALSLPLAAGGH
jgi:signal transduction histidine kinase